MKDPDRRWSRSDKGAAAACTQPSSRVLRRGAPSVLFCFRASLGYACLCVDPVRLPRCVAEPRVRAASFARLSTPDASCRLSPALRRGTALCFRVKPPTKHTPLARRGVGCRACGVRTRAFRHNGSRPGQRVTHPVHTIFSRPSGSEAVK